MEKSYRKYRNKDWLEEQYIILDKSADQIAKESYCTVTTIETWRRRHGIPVKRKSLSGPNNPMYGRTGERNPFFGKHHTEETKRKISEMNKGKNMGDSNPAKRPEVRAKLRKPKSDETRKRMSDAQKGKPRRKGWHQTEEVKRKVSEANKGEKNGMYGRRGELSPRFGVEVSKETREKMAKRHHISGKDHYLYGKTPPPGAGRGKKCYFTKADGMTVYLRSSYELYFAIGLERNEIKWEYERRIDLKEYIWHPDFYLPDYDMYVEVKGYLTDNSKQKMISFYNQFPDIKMLVMQYKDIINFLDYNKPICDVGMSLEEYLKVNDAI